MAKKWTHQLTEALVSIYEMHPVLYKTDSPGYHNNLLRHKALEIIKDELEKTYKQSLSTDEILKKINNLRTQFADNLRKMKKSVPSGSGGDIEKPSWWLFNSLSFLQPYLKKDKGISNINNPIEVEVQEVANLDSNDMIEEGEYVLGDGGTLTVVNENEESSTDSRPESEPPIMPTTVTPKSLSMKRKSKKRKVDAADEVNQSMIDAIKKISEDKPSDFSSDIETFIQYVGAGLNLIKKPALYRKCKKEILSVIDKFQTEDEDCD